MPFRLFWEKLWIWRVSTPTWSRPMFKRRVSMFWNYLEHRIFSICSMKNGTFHCDCKIGYGGDTCQLTPCSTCAAWDAIGPAGSNHKTYDQRNSYCDSIGKDFISWYVSAKETISYGLEHLMLNLQSADPNDPACENSGTCHDCVNHKSICQAHIVRKLQFLAVRKNNKLEIFDFPT